MNTVWVFNGDGSTFPAGVFATKEVAETWIAANRLTGCLTRYPLDISVYDWVIANELWEPKHDYQRQPQFIQRFSSAFLDHYHYQDGDQSAG